MSRRHGISYLTIKSTPDTQRKYICIYLYPSKGRDDGYKGNKLYDLTPRNINKVMKSPWLLVYTRNPTLCWWFFLAGGYKDETRSREWTVENHLTVYSIVPSSICGEYCTEHGQLHTYIINTVHADIFKYRVCKSSKLIIIFMLRQANEPKVHVSPLVIIIHYKTLRTFKNVKLIVINVVYHREPVWLIKY